MKQYILKYQDFLNEALTPEESKKYSKIKVVEDVKAIHNKIFGKDERIYIPFDLSMYGLVEVEKSKTQLEIENLFASSTFKNEKTGKVDSFEIISYNQNQCKCINDSRITTIGKVLQNKKYFNNPKLAVEYGQDVDKSRVIKQSNNLYVCISRNSDDIASMSTDRDWYSCQNIRTGSYKEYVAKDIKEGSIIAYLVKSTDKEIKDPEARILIKPFISILDNVDILLLPATKVYHRGTNLNKPQEYPKFYTFLMSWVKSVQPNMNGIYKMNTKVYQDGESTYDFLDKEEKKRILENPKTIQDFLMVFRYYNVPIEHYDIKIIGDGLLSYKGSMEFDISGRLNFMDNAEYYVPDYYSGGFDDEENDYIVSERFDNIRKWFSFFKIVDGDLKFEGCKYLQDLKGFDNLEYIDGDFDLSNTGIYDCKGLEKLKRIDGEFILSGSDIEFLDGLESLEYVESGISMDNCSEFQEDFDDVLPKYEGTISPSKYMEYFQASIIIEDE